MSGREDDCRENQMNDDVGPHHPDDQSEHRLHEGQLQQRHWWRSAAECVEKAQRRQQPPRRVFSTRKYSSPTYDGHMALVSDETMRYNNCSSLTSSALQSTSVYNAGGGDYKYRDNCRNWATSKVRATAKPTKDNKCQTPLHGHQLRHVVQHHQRTSSQQFYNKYAAAGRCQLFVSGRTIL